MVIIETEKFHKKHLSQFVYFIYHVCLLKSIICYLKICKYIAQLQVNLNFSNYKHDIEQFANLSQV